MKTYRLLILAALTLTASGFTDQTKKKIIFFGDSITQFGANAGGYIRRLDTLLEKNCEEKNYELIGAGIGGNKIYDLYLRLDDDVLSKNPDVVVIWIGVNDVWHKQTLHTGTDQDKFQKFYEAIIKKLQDRNIKVILCTPALISEKKFLENVQDRELNQYANIIRELGQKYNCPLLDFREEFTEYLKDHNPDDKQNGILTVDGVHLNSLGNQLVAEEMYKVISCFKNDGQ